MHTVALVGGSGYIGKFLVEELTRHGGYRIKLLSRSANAHFDAAGVIETVKGDLQDAATLHGFLETGCTVVNLAYLWNAGAAENLRLTNNLLDACKAAGVRRLIHVSTAAVVGRVPDDEVTERTAAAPVTEYGITKLAIEQAAIEAARGHYDCAILRPTAVFGPAGEPLKKLAGDLTHGNRTRNYLKSCLFGKRRMNLVHVANVAAAIRFLIERTENLNGATLIVSDDDAPSNNFVDVERRLMRALGLADYALPRLFVPLGVLAFLLRCLGRNNINPRCNYSQARLTGLGFRRPVDFEAGLAEYAVWYRSSLNAGERTA